MDYLKEESGGRYLDPKCSSQTMELSLRESSQRREARESCGDRYAVKGSANLSLLRGN